MWCWNQALLSCLMCKWGSHSLTITEPSWGWEGKGLSTEPDTQEVLSKYCRSVITAVSTLLSLKGITGWWPRLGGKRRWLCCHSHKCSIGQQDSKFLSYQNGNDTRLLRPCVWESKERPCGEKTGLSHLPAWQPNPTLSPPLGSKQQPDSMDMNRSH